MGDRAVAAATRHQLPMAYAYKTLSLACVAIALNGVEVMNFWAALVWIGIGWSFIFVHGTTLLTECHRPAERAKEGGNNLAIFMAMGPIA